MARVSSKSHSFAEGNPSSSIAQKQTFHIKRQFTPFQFRLTRAIKKQPLLESVIMSAAGRDDINSDKQKLESVSSPQQQQQQQPMIRVCFSVPFRCHSRQMLCIGGSQFPFGWSFVSIAKLPMTWNPNDIWTTEVYLPLGMRLEYKYVILEEQVWTNQKNDDAEGIVEIGYRSGDVPGQPPDVQKIRKQMAIVDWQPGPNRVIQVPLQDEIDSLFATKKSIQRKPARSRPFFSFRKLDSLTQQGPFGGTLEELHIDKDGEPVLYRQDVWPYKSASLTFEDARRFFLGE